MNSSLTTPPPMPSSPAIKGARFLQRQEEATFIRGITAPEVYHKVREQLEARPKAEKAAVKYHHRRNIERRTAEFLAGPVHRAYPLPEYRELAARMMGCRQRGPWGVNAAGGIVVAWEEKCGLVRLCPDESRQEGRRVKEAYGPALNQLMREGCRLHWAVFSLPNFAPGQLAAGKKEAFKLFRDRIIRTRHKGKARFPIVGALVVQEDPLSAHGDWNVHLNVLLLCDGFLDYGDLRAAWNADPEPGAPLPWQVEIAPKPWNLAEAAMDKLWRETIKYAVQAVPSKSIEKWEGGRTDAPAFTDWPPELAHEWWQAGKRFRRTRAYGRLKSVGAWVLKAKGQLMLSKVIWLGHFTHEANRYRVSCATVTLDLIREGLRDNSTGPPTRETGAGSPRRRAGAATATAWEDFNP